MRKKAIFILFVGIVCCLSAKAQKGIRYNMKVTGLSEMPVSSRDSADFYRIIFPPDTIDKTWFLINDYYKNGNPKMIGKTSNPDPRMIQLQGMSIAYFPNGEKKTEKNFDNGIPIGEINRYFPNGKLYLAGNCDKSGKLTINECRDSTGKVLAKNGDGHCIQYDEDFKRISAEGDIINGLEEGEWHGILRDSARYTCIYEKGVSKKGTGYDKKGNAYPFTTIEVEPKFKGGEESFRHLLAKNMHYPKTAKENNIQGKVFIAFTVDKDGALTDVRVVRGIGGGCDEEALKVIKLSSPWLPGVQYGMPVRVQYTIPVSFTLAFDN